MRMTAVIQTGAVMLAVSSLPVIAQDQAATGAYGAFADIAVADLVGQNVVGASGEALGEVETLVKASAGDDVMVVLGVGGFLGFGEHDVAIPIDALAIDEGVLRLSTFDIDSLKEMPGYDGTGEAMPMNVTVSGNVIAEEAVPLPGDAPVTE